MGDPTARPPEGWAEEVVASIRAQTALQKLPWADLHTIVVDALHTGWRAAIDHVRDRLRAAMGGS